MVHCAGSRCDNECMFCMWQDCMRYYVWQEGGTSAVCVGNIDQQPTHKIELRKLKRIAVQLKIHFFCTLEVLLTITQPLIDEICWNWVQLTQPLISQLGLRRRRLRLTKQEMIWTNQRLPLMIHMFWPGFPLSFSLCSRPMHYGEVAMGRSD